MAFSFLKRKKTARDMGIALLPVIKESELDELISNSELAELAEEIGREHLRKEILYLRLFALDIAVSEVLGNSSAKETVSAVLHEHMRQASFHSFEIAARLNTYNRAVRTPRSPFGSGYTMAEAIGEVFAKLCGMEKNALVANKGALIFHGSYKYASIFIKSYKVY